MSPDILRSIEETLKDLDRELRELSLDIHSHHAHDVLTKFMAKHGFEVTEHYHLETAWRAKFTNGEGGRTIGVNSEPILYQRHHLSNCVGVGVAIAVKKALEKFNLSGTVELLGTPAEETGDGKVDLLKAGAYKDMAACLMFVLPIILFLWLTSLRPGVTRPRDQLDRAHAALSPWEGRNAQDAAVLAYNNISALRQQILPTHRVHGIFQGTDWVANIIPDNSKMRYLVRAPTMAEAQATVKRVVPCFEAASIATGCEVNIAVKPGPYDLRQNSALGGEVAKVVTAKYGSIDYEWGIKYASTDFGNVSYAVPSLHPGFAIPTVVGGGNHTSAFEQAAATIEAHYACLDVTKALAATGVRVLIDDDFAAEVKKAYDEDTEIQKHHIRKCLRRWPTMLDLKTLVIYGLAFGLPIAYLAYRHYFRSGRIVSAPSPQTTQKPLKTIMQAAREDLAPPKDDPYTTEELKKYDGNTSGLPIYVAIKGTVFDVSHKADVYGPGRSYAIFAGKDGSKGLGMSSLKPEHAVADYSDLAPADLKVLDDWHAFFSKRYNIVGKVVDPPTSSL
ncbi:hypothetical protein DXG01_004092 [Tephrocybe rancida]|nr:hypothetical protein DXG01_004092 [Tephrocybe rancida]